MRGIISVFTSCTTHTHTVRLSRLVLSMFSHGRLLAACDGCVTYGTHKKTNQPANPTSPRKSASKHRTSHLIRVSQLLTALHSPRQQRQSKNHNHQEKITPCTSQSLRKNNPLDLILAESISWLLKTAVTYSTGVIRRWPPCGRRPTKLCAIYAIFLMSEGTKYATASAGLVPQTPYWGWTTGRLLSPRPLNLGFSFLNSKYASDKKFIGAQNWRVVSFICHVETKTERK